MREAKTFILMWNPEISNMKDKEWKDIVNHFPFYDLSWSVWEYDKARAGDECFLVRIGKHGGIVLSGCFTKNPEMGRDWSGKGRTTFYCKIYPRFIMDAIADPIITTEELQKSIPTFDWCGGHSGRMLTPQESQQLNQLWGEYCNANKTFIDNQLKRSTLSIEKEAAQRVVGFDKLVECFKKEWIDNNYTDNPDDMYYEDYFHDTANLSFHIDYNTSTFTLDFLLQDGILPITCKKLAKFKADLESGLAYLDEFKLFTIGDKYLCLKANNIEVICEEISFGDIKPYEEDFIPTTI